MPSTLIPRGTLFAACIAKAAHDADAAADKPTAAQEAIATADSYLQNAVLPTYSELQEALVGLLVHCANRGVATGTERDHSSVQNARALAERHDRTLAGDFRG